MLMKCVRIIRLCGYLLVALAALLCSRSAVADVSLEEFAQAIAANDSLSDAQRSQAAGTIEQLKADDEAPSYIASEVLMQLYPKFEDAMAALGEEETEAAVAKLAELAKSDDKHLAAEATYYIGRAHMMSEHYELALPVWKSILEEHAETTFRTPEALFFKGMSESQLLKRKEAIASLDKFILDYEDAPERMQVAAWHELELLRAIEDGTLVDVQDRMDFSRRRLAIEETDEDTQEEQDKIVAMLQKLIEQAEQQEQQNGSCPNGGS